MTTRLPALRPDLFGRFLAALGLLRVADERGPAIKLGWPDPFRPALLDGDLDALVDSVVADAQDTLGALTRTDLPDHPLWLLAGQQRMSTTLAAAIPLLTADRVLADLLTDGTPHPDVATLRWDPTRLSPAALRGSTAPGAGSRGVPTQEYLAWRGLGDTLWTPFFRDGPPRLAIWPIWRPLLAPRTAIGFAADGAVSTWTGRATLWSAAIRYSGTGYHREVAPGRPVALVGERPAPICRAVKSAPEADPSDS